MTIGTIDYGWAAPPLVEQLEKQGRIYCSDRYGTEFFERARESFTFMHVRGLITGPERNKIMGRLTKLIMAHTRLAPGAIGRDGRVSEADE